MIQPCAEQLDRDQTFPYDIVAEIACLGLMGLTLAEEYGGSKQGGSGSGQGGGTMMESTEPLSQSGGVTPSSFLSAAA